MSALGTTVPLYIVDAFTDKPFHGNPAAICLLKQKLSDEEMQRIAAEMNLSETAYIQGVGSKNCDFTQGDRFSLRWFTPTNEVPLCGHATMASAAVLFFVCDNPSSCVTFETLSGDLIVQKQGKGITMNFPLNTPQPENFDNVEELLKLVTKRDTIDSVHYSSTTKKLLVRLKDTCSREDLESLKPDITNFQNVESSGRIRGVIVTVKEGSESANGDKKQKTYDFLSRYFAPWNGIPEDPVTGSAHTVLAGYWTGVLGKDTMHARQCSKRGGDVTVHIRDDGRVDLTGEAAVVLRGSLTM
ncbi:phenazine biosynthesis-like domain-containing protein [Mizuhopecten yessoensis]|uniref:Phenazine biosynthesis-like domain-containing protein n=1 Tax=Mizuhopecten yessoensis TaxID=6573 RepID=A0A210QSV5_MIZYE|nr:phenazine biosynthesis-like domain-containing protein [Mizuhopecten yessoensis]OWF51847.1 Phenazine biosynthesis-like domain-containing protein [Mizuhopecten yessoensis]